MCWAYPQVGGKTSDVFCDVEMNPRGRISIGPASHILYMERGKRSTEECDQTALAVLKLDFSKTTKFKSFVIEQMNIVIIIL